MKSPFLSNQLKLGIATLFIIPMQSFASAPSCKNLFTIYFGPAPGVRLDLVNEMQSRPVSNQEARLGDALRSAGLVGIEASQNIISYHDNMYTVTLPEGRIKNQNKSGRCWIFAGLNAEENRHYVLKDLPIESEFSRTYLHFFNMLERANSHLDNLISMRKGSNRIKSTTLQKHFNPKIEDGGFYEDFLFLVEKYGIVPVSAMPETFNSLNSETVLAQLNDYITAKSLELWSFSENIAGQSKDPFQRFIDHRLQNSAKLNETSDLPKLNEQQLELIEAKKEEILRGVWKILETNLGRPPQKFITKILANGKTELREFTPLDFSKGYLKFDPNRFVTVGNLPNRNQPLLLEVKYPNMQRKMKVLNLGPERMKELIKAMIDSGQPVWFASDVSHSIDHTTGVMHPLIKNADGLYPFSPEEKPQDLSVSKKNYLGLINDNHAMVFFQYDMPMGVSWPIKYGVENSWTAAVGTGGNYHAYPTWIDQNVGQIIIDISLLTPEERAVLEGHPHQLSPNEDYR